MLTLPGFWSVLYKEGDVIIAAVGMEDRVNVVMIRSVDIVPGGDIVYNLSRKSAGGNQPELDLRDAAARLVRFLCDRLGGAFRFLHLCAMSMAVVVYLHSHNQTRSWLCTCP